MVDRMEAAYEDAARRALAAFPLEARALQLVSVSENITFRVSSPDGDFALRLHRPGYNTLAELESERAWAAALQDAGIGVQRALRTQRGTHFCTVGVDGEDERRQVGVTSWLAGTPLAEYLASSAGQAAREDVFRQIGRLAATLHLQSASWREPPGFTRPRLDSEGLLGEAPRWGRFWEHPALTSAERTLLRRGREQMRARLRDYGISSRNFGLIHADLHAENILVSGEAIGLIDFDDAAYGWFVYDLATALVEHWGDGDFPQLRAALLDGYRRCRDLPARDEAMLEAFVALRGMAIIGWFGQRPEHARSSYFRDNAQRVLDACSRLREP
jgi:Ser/Thr protein kinase RdoA (MazF antagonist)